MASKIKFRKEALKQLTSPEQLDQLIRVVTPNSWIISGTCYLILLIAFVWSIFGSIPTRVEGQGILLAGGGDIYNAVAPDGPSFLETIPVNPGDKVTKGQVVATLSRPDLIDKIKVLNNYLTELNASKDKLVNSSQTAITTHQQETQTQRDALKNVIAATQQKEQHLANLLAVKEAAFKKGIEIRQNVEQTFQEYYGVKIELEGYNDKMVQLDIGEANFKDEWNERLRQLNLKIADETMQLNNLKIQLSLSKNIVSPIDGKVTNIRGTIGSVINVGNPVVSIASDGVGLDALIYLPPQAGKRVKPTMLALISPVTVEKAEFGSINGIVTEVAEFPSSAQEVLSVLQNEELVKQFFGKEVPLAVRVHLKNNPDTFSGLSWSSSHGPQVKITPGTLAIGLITIRQQAPITLVVPALKKLWGIE
ncbi:MAG: NHLP bacteriocin system secretion protein [Legionella sp.]